MSKAPLAHTLPAFRQVSPLDPTASPLWLTKDAAASPLSTFTAAVTPQPYEELDSAFIHSRWTADVNTSRRSDHNSRFKTT